ncbi:methylated-DNA--protein-cysteine methyltransferase isoform X2 [Elgaria multicarinata webbii]|uniref:methylated-DNA--protein-cysteine methyltransferase isoform X2 n=1 Tax=Elgaria multicarinata webbii TaxID=159646 RepID=UPI002FCD0F67
MASKLHQKAPFKDVKTQCEKMCVVLGSPVGRIEISGCKTGVHEIRLQENAVSQNDTMEASVSCEVCESPEEMTEPLEQCTAWLQAYFCDPWMTEKLPMPPFHHPLLEKGPDYNTMPQSDLQQWTDWQLHGRKSSERVAFVT